MLQHLRDKTKSFISSALLVLLIISFGIWGIGDMFRQSQIKDWVAKVGDTKISPLALQREFQNQYQQLRMMLGDDFTKQKAQQLGLAEQALEKITSALVVDLEAKKLGLNIAKNQIIKTLEATPQLRNADGSFNKDLFQRMLQQQGLSEANFIDNQRLLLARNLLLRGVTLPLATPPDSVVNDLAKAAAQKRVADIVRIDPAAFSAKAPTAAELKATYDANKDSYKAPETRDFTMLTLTPADVMKEVRISEQDMKDAHSDPKQTTEAVKAQLQNNKAADIMVQTANKIDDMLAAGKKLEEIAASLNLPIRTFTARHTGGQGPDNAKIPFDKQSVKTLFATNENEVSPLVEALEGGFYVLRVNKINPTHIEAFESVTDKVKADFERKAKGDKAVAMAQSVSEQLKTGKALGAITGEGLTKITSAAITLDDTAQNNVPREVLAPLFDLPKGGVAVVSTHDGEVALRVKDIIAGDATEIEKRSIATRNKLASEWADEHLATLNRALRKTYAITVDEVGLKRLFSAGDEAP